MSILMALSKFDHTENGDALYAMELALSLKKLTNEKLLNLHCVAERNHDMQLIDMPDEVQKRETTNEIAMHASISTTQNASPNDLASIRCVRFATLEFFILASDGQWELKMCCLRIASVLFLQIEMGRDKFGTNRERVCGKYHVQSVSCVSPCNFHSF
ncbi:hypothetical protein CRYUN_Cryun39dG0077400 [Craigia yunnanensis]